MKDVCSACHAAPFVENFYTQYDALVNLYNEKFARPGVRIMKSLKEGELISSSTEFDDKIEWTWFLLWHHQGRRARHGASMFAPDYTQWHGMFDVAEIFYTEFIPEVRSILQHAKESGKARAAADTEKILQEILDSPDHAWFTGKMSESEKTKRRKAQEEFNKRYLPE
jgi:ribosomal protein L31